MFSHAVASRTALCLFAAAAVLSFNGAAAYPNGMFPTPPLGWSGYQALMQGSGQPPPPPHARLRALAHRRVGMPCGLEAACDQCASQPLKTTRISPRAAASPLLAGVCVRASDNIS